jgi:hypothetical protein
MKPLTFGGFLKQYVRELSGQDTLSICRLAAEAGHENPRLREPLELYAVFYGKADMLLRAAKGSWLNHNILHYSPEELSALLAGKTSQLPENYKKVYRSYLSVSSKKQSDDHTKALLQKRIRDLQKENHISNYRLYRELNLNPGNANAYLKHGDPGKVSLETARKLLEVAKRGQEHGQHA